MTRAVAEGARETGVPDTVITPPGVRVCEPIMYSDSLLGVITWVPIVIGGGVVKALRSGTIGIVVRV